LLRIDSYNFAELKEKLKLKCDFPGFTTMLIKLVNNCITDEDHYKAVMTVNSDSTAELCFLQILDYKAITLLQLKLHLGEEDEINAHASYRFKLRNYELAESKMRLQEIVDVLKKHNPSLIT
jgi:hypothetical protein